VFALLSSTARHSIVRKSTQQQAILADPEMALRTSNANFSLRQASLSQAFDILCKILRLKWRDPPPEVGDTQRRIEFQQMSNDISRFVKLTCQRLARCKAPQTAGETSLIA